MKNFLLFICICLAQHPVFAQVDKNSNLYKIILLKDSLLFDVGFNTCNVEQLESLLSDDLKFYHDKDGISDKTKFLYDLKNGLCKNSKTLQVRRTLVKESTKIFPLYKNGILYGAIQHGEHLFYEKQEIQPGIAKFTNVWQLENNDWKLITSLSFDHKAYHTKKTENSIFDNDNEIDKWLKENKVPTLGIGIIKDGKLSQIKVFGNSASYNTLFNVASLTKPMTAMVALKLAEQGKWNLDEPVYKYWTDPDVAHDPKHKKLVTRFILSHQTGFSNWRWMNEDKKLRFDFEPGTAYRYSGEGYEYLRKALENKFKKSLQELAEELIWQPLQMNDTRYIWDENVDVSRYATGYDENGKAYEVVKNSTPNAADDLLTTIGDYGTFLVNLMNGNLLSEKAFKEMATPQTASEKGKHFCLGFEVYALGNGEYALAHGGTDVGVRSIVFIIPETKQGLLIFTNSDTGGNLYETLVKHYLGEYGQKIIDIETK